MNTNSGRMTDALRERSERASALVVREIAAAGLSREQFALRVGVSTAHVKRWEAASWHVPLALVGHEVLAPSRWIRITTCLIDRESPAILPMDHAERAVVVAALECVREIAAPANDNAHSATVTDLTLYRSVVRLRKACDSLLASLPAEVRRAA